MIKCKPRFKRHNRLSPCNVMLYVLRTISWIWRTLHNQTKRNESSIFLTLMCYLLPLGKPIPASDYFSTTTFNSMWYCYYQLVYSAQSKYGPITNNSSHILNIFSFLDYHLNVHLSLHGSFDKYRYHKQCFW